VDYAIYGSPAIPLDILKPSLHEPFGGQRGRKAHLDLPVTLSFSKHLLAVS